MQVKNLDEDLEIGFQDGLLEQVSESTLLRDSVWHAKLQHLAGVNGTFDSRGSRRDVDKVELRFVDSNIRVITTLRVGCDRGQKSKQTGLVGSVQSESSHFS